VLLAVLLWKANQPVPLDEIAEMVWDGSPPGGARETVRALVMRLRRQLDKQASARIVTRAPGYAIEVSGGELDAERFETLTREAGAAVRAARWARAASTAVGALELWRGAPLVDILSQMLRDQWVPGLDQLHMQVLEWRIEADLHAGRHDQLIPELQDLAARHPLREHFHGQLMLALVRSGRQAEALAAYQAARRMLVGELGIDPGAELRQLHERILAGDASLMTPPTAAGAARPGSAAALVPRQLPAAVRSFAGRQAELGRAGAARRPALGRAACSSDACCAGNLPGLGVRGASRQVRTCLPSPVSWSSGSRGDRPRRWLDQVDDDRVRGAAGADRGHGVLPSHAQAGGPAWAARMGRVAHAAVG
jgi:DNA-binding SARP family transcriptional activator